MFLRFRNKLYGASALLILVLGVPTFASAGAKIKVDDTKWFSVGMGFRSSIAITEDGADNGTGISKNIGTNNMRLYTAAKVHENITVEYNTEIASNNESDFNIRLLDAVVKFNIAGFDFWTGRFLPPSDRSNLDGPFYLNAFDFPGVAQAYPAIHAGRDNGAAIMKEYNGGQFKFSYGVFEGRTINTNADSNPDQEDNFLHAARATINFWDPEPGYYTTSSYYGAKDVLALAFVYQHEDDGAGSNTDALRADFDAWSIDFLMEKKNQNGSVVNLEGAFYNYDTDNKADTSITQGQSYLLLGSYLMPNSIGWGKLQPYVRQQHFAREAGADGGRWRTEGGLNYIIDGQNAKLNATYYVDKNGGGADEKGTFLVGFQFQL